MSQYDLENTISPSKQADACSTLHPETRIVAAIDFGTTHSGFAMAHVDDKVIHLHRDWDNQPGHYAKNLTCIRYDSNGEALSWGYTARYEYSQSIESYAYERFKLYLDPEFDVKIGHLPIPSQEQLTKIISDYLCKLHDFFFENHLEKMYGKMYDSKSISWVLTVPAMWDERAKQVMTDAAVAAGIVTAQDVNDKARFNIVLEPEAAALMCCENSDKTNLKPGDSFIVVDAGGGTVDLTAYRVSQGVSSLKELCDGIGECCGSTFIDDQFFASLEEKCGLKAISQFREKHPLVWFRNFVQPWEQIKREFKGPESFPDNQSKGIEVPPLLRKLMSKEDVDNLENHSDGEIQITLKDMTTMFDYIIEKIIQLIEKQLSSCNNLLSKQSPPSNVNKIFLVGGFSGSDYLFKAIKDRFGNYSSNMLICRPLDTGSAIVSGAVLAGLNQRFITARCARYTYGLRVSDVLTVDNPATEAEKFWNDCEGKYFANNLFHTMVLKGQQIGIDELISENFVPTEENQNFAKFEIYQTDLCSAKYITLGSTIRRVKTLLVPISVLHDEQPSQARMQINIVQDVSGSMAGTRINACKNGIKSLCDVLGPNDEVGVIEFADSVNILSDISDSPISREELPDYVDSMQIHGWTALYDAIYEGIRTLKAGLERCRDLNMKNILIVYTDGVENSSKTSFSILSNMIKNHGIPNFRFIFANAASDADNLELLNLCRTAPCKEFSIVVPVQDSKEGITSAFTRIRQDIKIFQNQNSDLSRKSVQLQMAFGDSKITAKATCESTGQTRECSFEFFTTKAID